MKELSYNLFGNFQSTVFKAVKIFLSKKMVDGAEKSVTTSLRIPIEIKEFYDSLAEAEMTSINAAITNTLSKVKDQTISEYQKTYTKINDIYDYQITSLLKIIDAHKIDYNDFCALLEWVIGAKVSRADITNKEILMNLFDKKSQIKLCRIFGYSYEWLQDNNHTIYYKWDSLEAGWYKNVQIFVGGLIKSFYLDETVQSFNLSFLCCDGDVVKNIISGIYPGKNENITPIIISDRNINGVLTRTYHRFESNDINYEKCRNYFIVLVKVILMLVRHGIINHPNGYLVTPQQHDMIQDGKMHLVDLFSKNKMQNHFHIEDLEPIETRSFSPDQSKKTSKPNIYHVLGISILTDISSRYEPECQRTELTDELAAKFGMSQVALAKYLQLFDYFDVGKPPFQNNIMIHSKENEPVYINLSRLREVQLEMHNGKKLDTSFG